MTARQTADTMLLDPPPVPPSGAMRLPLEWHRQRASLLAGQLRSEGLSGILLTDPWNIIYFTGLWALSTERLLYAFLPSDGSDPVWFYPTLDRDLVQSWWYGDGEEYFDWPHVDGGFPNLGQVRTGPAVDLWRWVLSALRKRGYGGPAAPVAIDAEQTLSRHKGAIAILDQAPLDFAGRCMAMRIVKTAEELALTRRAYTYYDKVHILARELLLQRGPDLTDFGLRTELIRFATQMIAADLGPDQPLHQGVGINVDLHWVRTGRITGYPHPNQFRHAAIHPGSMVQVSGIIQVGGHGGECYRPFLLPPRTAHHENLWRIARDSCLLQKDLMRAGATCADVAAGIHRFQIDQGAAPHIYHRPAHGVGTEGHQPPSLALGDQTVLQPGMCFSVEPGLYDPEDGFGVNFSDMFVVQEKGPALQMSTIPWTEEWCWLED